MYQSCPDSLKEYLTAWQTAHGEYKFNSLKSLDLLEKMAYEKEKDRLVMMRYCSVDFYAYISYSKSKNDFQFEFCYVSPQDTLCCLRLLNTEGYFKKNLVTKSGASYSIDHEWGFIELKKNKLCLLNGFFNIDKISENEVNFTIIPFKGTNTLVWTKMQDGKYLPAF